MVSGARAYRAEGAAPPAAPLGGVVNGAMGAGCAAADACAVWGRETASARSKDVPPTAPCALRIAARSSVAANPSSMPLSHATVDVTAPPRNVSPRGDTSGLQPSGVRESDRSSGAGVLLRGGVPLRCADAPTADPPPVAAVVARYEGPTALRSGESGTAVPPLPLPPVSLESMGVVGRARSACKARALPPTTLALAWQGVCTTDDPTDVTDSANSAAGRQVGVGGAWPTVAGADAADTAPTSADMEADTAADVGNGGVADAAVPGWTRDRLDEWHACAWGDCGASYDAAICDAATSDAGSDDACSDGGSDPPATVPPSAGGASNDAPTSYAPVAVECDVTCDSATAAAGALVDATRGRWPPCGAGVAAPADERDATAASRDAADSSGASACAPEGAVPWVGRICG